MLERIAEFLVLVLSNLEWVYLNIKPSNLLTWQTALPPFSQMTTFTKYLNPLLEWWNLISIPTVIFLIYTYRILSASMRQSEQQGGIVGPGSDREVRVLTVFDGEGNVADPGWLVWWGDVLKDRHGKVEKRWTVDPQKLTRGSLEERRKWRRGEREAMEKEESNSCLCSSSKDCK
ncbi:hypothetical protein JCM5353_002608 [Sporobolomyces roseus]